MSFITLFSTYCYIRMPEGLKNADPTYCRMTKAILKDQIYRNVFTYVDDIVVASKRMSTQIEDCVFGVQIGKVLGCFEANLDKIKAIVHMKPPQTRKEL
jgi:hypothetical protein